jgi:surface antigen
MRRSGFRKFFFAASLIAVFSAQLAAPALAWRDDDDRGHHGGYQDRHGNGWRGDGRHYGNHRGYDRHNDRHTNFSVFIGQGYGPGYGYYAPPPVYRPYRRPPHDVYYGRNDSNLLGTLFGGAVGGIAGSQIGDGSGRTAAIIGGTVIGAIFGNSLGRDVSPYDHVHAANVFEVTPAQQTVAWQNPDNGMAYQVTPTRTYQLNTGQYCREYQATATVGGRPQATYGTACRTPDGDWQIMN